jgi:hypothetical protein
VLVSNQSRRLIAEHGDAVLGDPPQFSMCNSMTHWLIQFSYSTRAG